MSVFALKILAMVSMFTDHLAHALLSVGRIDPQLYFLCRSLGRVAFPVYAFLIVNGLEHSSDRKKYLSRLLVFALISQTAFSLFFGSVSPDSGEGWSFAFSLTAPHSYLLTAAAAAGALLYRDIRMLLPAAAILLPFCSLSFGKLCLLGGKLNIFYTLALGMTLLWLIGEFKECRNKIRALKLSLLALGWLSAVLLIAPGMDYGWQGLALIAALGLCKGNLPVQAAMLALWGAMVYLPDSTDHCLGALLALPPVLSYSGERGQPVKIGFYAFYPLHLLLLTLLTKLLG